MSQEKTFQQELEALINKHSLERHSDTPDFILAEYMATCLHALNKAVVERLRWYMLEVNNEEVVKAESQ